MKVLLLNQTGDISKMHRELNEVKEGFNEFRNIVRETKMNQKDKIIEVILLDTIVNDRHIK